MSFLSGNLSKQLQSGVNTKSTSTAVTTQSKESRFKDFNCFSNLHQRRKYQDIENDDLQEYELSQQQNSS